MTQLARNNSHNRSTKRGNVRRELVLQSTKSLLLERNIQAIGVKDIAERAQIPISSIYNLFDDLSHIFASIVEDIWSEFRVFRSEKLLDHYANEAELISHSTRINFEFVMSNELARKTLYAEALPNSIKQTDKKFILEAISQFVGRHFPDLSEPKHQRQVELFRKQILIFDVLIADILSDADNLKEEDFDDVLEIIMKISD